MRSSFNRVARILFTGILFFMLVVEASGQRVTYPDRKFMGANIKLDKYGRSPVSIRLEAGQQVSAGSFFDEYRKSFPLSADNQLVEIMVFTDKLNQTHHRFQQRYKGIPVDGIQFILHEKKGKIFFANGRLVHDLDMNVNPTLSEDDALKIALNHIGAQSYMWENPSQEAALKRQRDDQKATFAPKGELRLTAGQKAQLRENFKLAYRFDIYAEAPLGRYYVYVDAKSGDVLQSVDRIHHTDTAGTGLTLYNGSVNITVDSFAGGYRLREAGRGGGIETYDMQNGTNYGSAVDFTDTDPNFTGANEQAGVSAHWGAENTYDYYFNQHGRNSFDDAGGAILSYVHYNLNYNNAFWDGTRMTYGDGDGVTFTPLVCLDVVGHEITHGVTQYSADLVYAYEPGALNESFSDVFGTAVEFYAEGPGGGDWIIGEDIYVPGGGTAGIRSMENPNDNGDPDTYLGDFWWTSPGDNGGVHTNSGVQNFWFYLLSVGGSGTNDNGDAYSVTGIGIDDAADIAYRNLTVYLGPNSQYADARAGAVNAAIDLFGDGSQQHLSTMDAWYAVGVYEAVPPEGILVYEGILGGQDYSGQYINDYLVAAGFGTINYTNVFPPSLIGYDAVFLSFGNYANNYTPFNDGMATAVEAYLAAGGRVYLEGGDALGYNQAGNTSLYNLFGISAAADGSTNSIDDLQGQVGALTEGMQFTSSTQVGNGFIDTYTPGSGTLAFVEVGYGDVGVQYDVFGGQKTFCFSYALAELVDGAAPSTRANIMAGLLELFDMSGSPPVIDVTPASFDKTLPPGGSDTVPMIITNNGTGDLEFNITVLNAINANSTSESGPASYNGNIRARTNLDPDETASGGNYSYTNESIVAVPYFDGFEDGNFTDWINDPGSGLEEVTNATAAEGTYSFHYNNTTLGHFHGIHQEFAAGSQPDYISFYIRSGSTTDHDAYFVLTANGDNTEVIWFYATGTGFLYVNGDVGGDASVPYNALQWYHIEYRDIDWTAKNFDYYVDGALVKADIPFRNPGSVNDIDRTYLYNFSSNADGWWDAIAIGSQVDWLSVSPTSGTVPPSGSITIDVTFDASTLTLGDYYANINIANNDPLNNPVVVPAHLEVTDVGPPDISVSPASFTFNVPPGGTANDILTISNTAPLGNANLDWDITEADSGVLLFGDGSKLRLQLNSKSNRIAGKTGFGKDKSRQFSMAGMTSLDPQPSSGPPPTSRHFAGSPLLVAIFQDVNPWGSTKNQDILTANGISFDMYVSGAMGSVDLSPYDKVVIASVQPDAFYTALSSNRTWFDSYVDAGGYLEMHLAAYTGSSIVGLPLPGGYEVTILAGGYQDVTIIDPAHPLVTTPNAVTDADLDNWNYSTHGYLTANPANIHVIIENVDATLATVENTQGSGAILATLQTVEWTLSYDPYLENMLLYGGPHADVPWLSETPTSGSTTPGGSDPVNVAVDATGLPDGIYKASLVIHSNDPDENPLVVPVTMEVGFPPPPEALIWIPDDVLNPNLPRKAQQRGLTLQEVQAISKTTTSHLELQAALEAWGKVVNTTSVLAPENLSLYEYVFVVLGIYPNNHVISAGDPDAVQLENYLAGDSARLYIEGGDTWYFDPVELGGHDFGPSFAIDGLADGADDLKTLLGACIAAGNDFVYIGQNNFIDHISPTAGSCTIYSNNVPSYGAGVAFNNTTPGSRTIGTVFEFGGMKDNSVPGGPSKADLMGVYLNFFDTGGFTGEPYISNGDVNGDGKISPGDALCAFKIFLSGQATPTDCDAPDFDGEVIAANANCDASVSPGDALSIFQRFLSGLPPEECFAAQGNIAKISSQVEPYRLMLQQRTVLQSVEANGRDVFRLSLAVDNPQGLSAFGLKLIYPAEGLEFLGIRRAALTESWTELDGQPVAAGELLIGGYSIDPVAENGAGEIFEVVFALKGHAIDPAEIRITGLTDDFGDAMLEAVDSGAAGLAGVPDAFKLHQNYPNPFKEKGLAKGTMIRFDLAGAEEVKVELSIYNITGQLVRRLVSGTRLPGRYEISWDGRDEHRTLVPSGTYFYRLKAGNFVESRPLSVVR